VYTSCYVRDDGKWDREKRTGYQVANKMVTSAFEVARCTNINTVTFLFYNEENLTVLIETHSFEGGEQC
jgi:hypothetical protein